MVEVCLASVTVDFSTAFADGLSEAVVDEVTEGTGGDVNSVDASVLDVVVPVDL